MRISDCSSDVCSSDLEAYATEMASENVEEELKRKIRIAAGGIQSILRLKRAPNPFADPLLAFQYISHRVLRWTVTPILLVVVLIIHAILHEIGRASCRERVCRYV